ncbi:spondin domain-containing protein [Photobacterium sagamiensis]|uniref:spondin domain-containing protein n=1 Tax=Photobacterium sagamiensis TaxID=2910241 RepID=UPI003D13B485
MKFRLIAIVASVGLLAGCPLEQRSYTVTVKNLTSNQPLSPVALLVHDAQYRLFSIGEASSNALERLAEAGDNSAVLAEKETNEHINYSFSGTGVILPGSSDTISFTIDPAIGNQMSLASMLVNTNDGFIGETRINIDTLEVGDSLNINMNVWDAGTEANDEASETVPGPAAGGKGFNSIRNDNDQVSFHPGVISKDDGLASSVLNGTHRFLNPGAHLIITRTD